MKSFVSFLASILSLATVGAIAFVSLYVTSNLWRKAIGANTADLIRTDRIDSATQYLAGIECPWWFGDFVQYRTQSSLDWLETAKSAVAGLSQNNINAERSERGQRLKAIETEIKELRDSSGRLKARYELLAAGTSELFHLELESEDPKFYKGGLLAGLPPLKGLQDDIRTLPELSAVITNAGGVVTVAEFAKALDGLVLEGQDLSAAFSANQLKSKDLEAEKAELLRTAKMERTRAQEALAEALETGADLS